MVKAIGGWESIMKHQLRRKMMKRLRMLENRSKLEQLISTRLIQTSLWKESRKIGFYYSIGLEWDTHWLIDQALFEGKIVTLPRTNPDDKSMVFYRYIGRDCLENVHQNLWEPIPDEKRLIEANEHDFLLVPGVVFDKSGYRIGYGGGYYDRYLKNFSRPTISIAIDEQIIDYIPREIHDIPVGKIITNTQVIDCT